MRHWVASESRNFFEFTEAVGRAGSQAIPPGLLGFPDIQECRNASQNSVWAQHNPQATLLFMLLSCLLLDVHQKSCATWYFSLGETQASNRDEQCQSQTDPDRSLVTSGPRHLYSTKRIALQIQGNSVASRDCPASQPQRVTLKSTGF